MRNKKIILACAVMMGIGSYFAYRETSKDLYFSDNDNEIESSTDQITFKKIPSSETERKVSVKEHKRDSGADNTEPESTLPSEKKISPKDMPLAKKMVTTSLSNNESIRLPSVKINFSADLYACSIAECSSSNSVLTTSGFNIFRSNSSDFKNDKKKALVTFEKENKQYGIWERRVIIETSVVIDLNQKLTKMKFESIERPQPLLYIAEYSGALEVLDGYLNELKSTADVKDVRLEITYSRNRPN